MPDIGGGAETPLKSKLPQDKNEPIPGVLSMKYSFLITFLTIIYPTLWILFFLVRWDI